MPSLNWTEKYGGRVQSVSAEGVEMKEQRVAIGDHEEARSLSQQKLQEKESSLGNQVRCAVRRNMGVTQRLKMAISFCCPESLVTCS